MPGKSELVLLHKGMQRKVRATDVRGAKRKKVFSGWPPLWAARAWSCKKQRSASRLLLQRRARHLRLHFRQGMCPAGAKAETRIAASAAGEVSC